MSWIDIQTLADRHEKLAARVAALEASQGKEGAASAPARVTPAVAAESPPSPVAGSSPARPDSPPAFKVGDRVLCGCQKLGTAEEKCVGTLLAIEGNAYEIAMDYGETVRHHGLSNLTPAPAAAEEDRETWRERCINAENARDAALRDLEARKRERDEARAILKEWEPAAHKIAQALREMKGVTRAD